MAEPEKTRKTRTPRAILVQKSNTANDPTWYDVKAADFTSEAEAKGFLKEWANANPGRYRIVSVIYDGTPTTQTKTRIVL
jgi:hypothetical protein